MASLPKTRQSFLTRKREIDISMVYCQENSRMIFYPKDNEAARASAVHEFLCITCGILLGLIDALLGIDFDSCFSYLIGSRNSINFGAPHFQDSDCTFSSSKRLQKYSTMR